MDNNWEFITELNQSDPLLFSNRGSVKENLGEFNSAGEDFDKAMDFLEKQIAETLQSEEAQEGITAFLEKRPPNWK